MASKPDLEFKVVFIGDSGVGKTCILQRIDRNVYTPSSVSTIGMDLVTKTLQSGQFSVRLNLWDTAGQERFRAMVRLHTRGSRGIFLVYSVDDQATFDACSEFYQSIQADGDKYQPLVFLVANKADLVENRAVSRKQGKALAKLWNMPYFECSAKKGEGITELVQEMADRLVAKFESAQTEMPRRTKSGLLADSPFRVENKPSSSSSNSADGGAGCSC